MNQVKTVILILEMGKQKNKPLYTKYKKDSSWNFERTILKVLKKNSSNFVKKAFSQILKGI